MALEKEWRVMGNAAILFPKSDIIFKIFFGDERNIELLKDFLKSVLSLPEDDYNEITIVDPHLLREYPKDKLGILDVKLTSKTGKIINLEIQVSPVPLMESRIIFYQAKMITEQIGSGDDYENIKRVINIVITDFNMIKGSPKYHHRFVQYDSDNGVAFTDLTEIHTLELSKLPENFDGTALCDWLKFLAAETEADFDMVAERSPQIQTAVVRLKELSADERTRMLYEAREKEQRDIRAREKGARLDGWKEGEKIGKEIGERRAFITVAQNMLKRGRPVTEIMEDTGLTFEDIERLQRNE
jgi:predicted transposase/invertase (TIGR01784 family)